MASPTQPISLNFAFACWPMMQVYKKSPNHYYRSYTPKNNTALFFLYLNDLKGQKTKTSVINLCIWVFLILVYLRCSHLAITDVWHWLKGEPNSLLCLDHHLAGVVPCEESHQGLGHLVEAVHNRLSHLDNKRTWQQDDMMEWQSYKSCQEDCSSPWSCRRQPSLPLPQSPPPTVVSTWAD